MTKLDEAALVAFVDGELDATSAQEVARRLAEDPAAQEKVRLLRSSAVLVRMAFPEPNGQMVPPRLVRLVASSGTQHGLIGRRRFGMAAASLAACAAGFAGGFGVHAIRAPRPGPAARLMDEIAEYHTVLARDSRGFGVVPASARPRIEAWFADLLGRRLAIPDLAAFGLDFGGARLLVVDGAPVTQLLYAARETPSRPFGVCVTTWSGANTPITSAWHDGVALTLWAQAGYAYVLVGWLRPAELARIAAAIRPALEAA